MTRRATRSELARQRQLWEGTQRDDSLDGMFASMRQSALQHSELEVVIAADPDQYLVGLPLPALCLRYLFQSTTYPLSRIMQITGEEGSCKSSLLFEVIRWHMVYGGGGVFIENEEKDSPTLRCSMLGWHVPWLRRLEIVRSRSLEDWQEALSLFTKLAADQQDTELGPGRTVPIAFGVDSLMSTAPREEIEKIAKAGFAQRNYALAANLISQYMKTMPDRLGGYPFSIIGTNHLKPTTDYMGRRVGNVPGGKSVKFMETYEIEMHRAPNPDIDLLDYGGIRLKLVARKNGLGPSRKQIGAEMLWWQEEYRDEHDRLGFRQQTAWDWDTATVELLLSFENAKGKKTIYNRLQEICDIRVTSKTSREAWSNTLGIPRDDPQKWRVVGAALERRPDILAEIYPVLGITPHRPFQAGVDYRDLLATAREQADAEAVNLYSNVDSMPQVSGEDFDPDGTLGVDPDEAMAETPDAGGSMPAGDVTMPPQAPSWGGDNDAQG